MSALSWALVACLALVAAQDLPTVHIVPHSHCDPGWLETYETYFAGDVSTILSNVFYELMQDPRRKFVWSETSFFLLWYETLSTEGRDVFKDLVQSGRFEFVGGGWVQNDEACPHYADMIDQTTTGHRYLNDQFGVVPRFGWQIDPFGHSAVTPALFRLFGYEAVVINRIHFKYKAAMKGKANMEFLWRGTQLGGNDDLFTHVLHTHYSAPQGFDWENYVEAITEDNVERRSDELAAELRRRMTAYRSPHLLVPFGDDFKFRNANLQFRNMDQLIDYINDNPERYQMRLQYSTLSDYFGAVAASNAKFATVQGDFFPYADNDDSLWTGYYTTRPFLKRISRTVSAALRAAEIAFVAAGVLRSDADDDEVVRRRAMYDDLIAARRNAALFLHHDGITGTARTHVVDDYMQRMHAATRTANGIALRSLRAVVADDADADIVMLGDDAVLSGRNVVGLCNSLGWARTELLCLTVATPFVTVHDDAGASVAAQVHIGTDFQGDAYRLCFVRNLPPLSVSVVVVDVADKKRPGGAEHVVVRVIGGSDQAALSPQDEVAVGDDSFILSNGVLDVHLDRKTGLIESIVDRAANVTTQVGQRLRQYSTSRGGAYLFRPEGDAEHIDTGRARVRLARGPVSDSAAVTLGNQVVHIDLVKASAPAMVARRVHVRFLVRSDANREVVVRFDTDLATGTTFYSNDGADFVRRRYDAAKQIAGNYYPAVSGGRLQDRARRLTVATGHTSGVTGGHGRLEFMLHRNLAQDDGRGLGQPIIDQTPAIVTMRIVVESTGSFVFPADQHRRQAFACDTPPVVLVGNVAMRPVRLLDMVLPAHMHLLSLMVNDAAGREVVVRLENLRDADQDTQATLLQVHNLFQDHAGLTNMRETTLTTVYEFPRASYLNDGYLAKATPVLQFARSDKLISLVDGGGEDMVGGDHQQGKQNAEEEGVFISDVALQKAKGWVRRLLDDNSRAVPFLPRQIRTFIFEVSEKRTVAKEQNEKDAEEHVSSGSRIQIRRAPIEVQALSLPGTGEVVFVVCACLATISAVVLILRSNWGSPTTWTQASSKPERHIV
ncbi:Alpha-mannosidase [Plasmodiophora brassicae]|uniref:Alpha-mannosidase n=1 Tax=Plasmodiophora brassicae TaxID=37360 RepID=A0A3P3Y1N7_PLABS|nr:unnamed protein product [Plasmodiophora brassicae]